MNDPVSFIDTYGIKEVHADAVTDQKEQTGEFFIYRSYEIPVQEKMFHPSRSTHFAIHLNLDAAIEIKYNLINYTVPKNALFIIHPGIVHALIETDHLFTISLGFSQNFLSAAMIHKKHPGGFGFLSQQSDPLFVLTEKEAETFNMLMLYLKSMVDDNGHPFKEEMIHHSFNLFMLEVEAIAKKYRGNDEQKVNRKEDILLNFLKQLAAHFKEERSVQFYADALFMTPKHLTKTVKELTRLRKGSK